NKGAAAYPQEVEAFALFFLCMEVLWKQDVDYNNLPGCSSSTTQTQACYSSARRWCGYIGQGGIGIPQEVGSSVTKIACVRGSWIGAVRILDLQQLHDGCRDGSLSQSADCAAAAHRWCGQAW